MRLPAKIEEAIDALSSISGIGKKTATRHVFTLLNWSKERRGDLGDAITSLSDVKECPECGLYIEESTCSVCSNDERANSGVICVVETISDAMALENSNRFNGLYHVLGGVLNPLLGVTPNDINLDGLVERARQREVNTLILALNSSIEGNATCSYIKSLFEEANPTMSLNIERIGFGMPIGGSLEYLDGQTIGEALENRRQM